MYLFYHGCKSLYLPSCLSGFPPIVFDYITLLHFSITKDELSELTICNCMLEQINLIKISFVIGVEGLNPNHEKMLLVVGWLSHKKQGLIAKVEGMR